MSSNYPPGAKDDPNAPYNEEPMPEVNVKLKAVMYRCVEKESYNPSRTLVETLKDCCTLLKQLKKDVLYRFAGIDIGFLLDECYDWKEAKDDASCTEVHNDKGQVETTVVLYQDTVIKSSGSYQCIEKEIDGDGSIVTTSWWEHPDLYEEYRRDSRTLGEALVACCTVLEKLKECDFINYAGIRIGALIKECEDWDEDEFDVSEG